ncbi:hypothetical protein AAVH_19971 [Aphelenchoides avenae]|nr:hypothetical protein AAVH_19971 [Aphelenchus avenae]
MNASSVIVTLDTGLPRAIKTFGNQYFFVALEPRRQYDDSDDNEDNDGQAETKVQLFQIDSTGTSAELIQDIPAGMDSISCIDVAQDADGGEGYFMSMAAYLNRQHDYYCAVYRSDDDVSDASRLQFRRVLSFKTDPDGERRQSCVRFDCSIRTERGVPKRLITAAGNSIRVWDLPELLRRAATDGVDPLDFPAPLLEMTSPHMIDDVQVSPCGSVIAAMAAEYDAGQAPVTLWDARSGQHVLSLEAPTEHELRFEAFGLRFLPVAAEDSVRFIVPFTSPPMAATHISVVTIGEMHKRTHECIMVNSELFPNEEIQSICVNADVPLIAVSSSVYHEGRSYLRAFDMSLRCVYLEDVSVSEARSHVDFVQGDCLTQLLSISNEFDAGTEDDVSVNRIRIRTIPLPPQGRRIQELLTPTNMAMLVILAIGIWLSYLFS